MSKQIIKIRDFNLFCEVMKSTAKIVDSAKLLIGPNGLEIYGAHGTSARCEIESNSIYADEHIEFAIEKIVVLNKILSTVKDAHDGDYSNLQFYYERPFVKFSSKKIKTKYSTTNEDIIANWISKKIEKELESVFDFTTTSDLIKKICSHSFMFNDAKNMKVYVETNQDMENNSVFATLGNRQNESGNEITLKFGIVTFGSIPDNRKIILDFECLPFLNAIQSDDIKVSLMNFNVVVSNVKISGNSNTFFNLKIYSQMLKG